MDKATSPAPDMFAGEKRGLPLVSSLLYFAFLFLYLKERQQADNAGR
jgi:hypothetical protein